MIIDLKTQEKLNINTQAFSGTDLNKSTNKMGIVYSFEPNELTDKQHTVSSIIDHHSTDICLVKHTEARNVECKTDDEVKYIKNECIAVEFKDSTHPFFDKPNVIVETPYRLTEVVKKSIYDYIRIYDELETKLFVYENNITQKHSDIPKDYYKNLGYYEWTKPKEVLSKEIIKDFKANIRFNIDDEAKLENIELDIEKQVLSTDLFPKSKANTHKQTIVKDIKDKKYTTEEVFKELYEIYLDEVCNRLF